MSLSVRSLRRVGSLSVVAVLSACGGGGGEPAGGNAVLTAPSSNPLVSSAADLALYPAGYQPGTVERGAFNELMRVRSACGFQLQTQNTRLDQAAFGHAYYLTSNALLSNNLNVVGHDQAVGAANFTGIKPSDRATAAGYNWRYIGEILDAMNYTYGASLVDPIAMNEARGRLSMRNLVHTVYHLSGALSEAREVGLGSSSQVWLQSAGRKAQAYRFGALFGIQVGAAGLRAGTGDVLSYPCASLTDVRPNFKPAVESPNPFPEITDTSVSVGTPIYFKANSGQTLQLTSFSMRRLSTNTLVATRLFNEGNDPAGYVEPHEVFHVPTAALLPNEVYTVVASGTINGVRTWSKSFSFTTSALE